MSAFVQVIKLHKGIGSEKTGLCIQKQLQFKTIKKLYILSWRFKARTH